MNIKNKIFLTSFSLAIILLLQSCDFSRTLAKALGQWKTPTWKTTNEIENFAQKDSVVYDAFYYVDNFKDWAKLSDEDLVNFPGIYLYDENLKPIQIFIGSDCPTKAMNYIDELSESSENIQKDTSLIPLDNFLERTTLLKGNDSFLKSKNSNFDYIFVYTWVTFVPKKAKEVFKTARKLKKNENINFKIIAINEDFMAEWNKKPEKMVDKKVDIDNLDKYEFKKDPR